MAVRLAHNLLSNKLQLRRPKDEPHIELLVRYLELEVREAFASLAPARDRLAPVKRLLAVQGLRTLSDALARELIPLANARTLRRFLASRTANPTLLQQLLEMAPTDTERTELHAIAASSRVPHDA